MKKSYLLTNILDYIILFTLIFTSRETLLFGTNQDAIMVMVGYICPVIVLLILLLRKHKDGSKSSTNLLVTLCACTIVTMFFNFDINIKYGYEILLYLLSYLIANQIKFDKFVNIFCDIILFLAFFAVFSAVVYYVTPSLLSLFPVVENKSNIQFYNMFLSVIPSERYGVFFRSYGIFREPGVAMIFFNIALIFELFFKGKKYFMRLMLLILAVGLTFSTAGYIVLLGIIAVYILNKNNKKSFGYSFVVVMAFIGGVFLISYNDYINMMVFGKFSNSQSSSTSARFGSVYNNISLIIEKPIGILWGLGYQYVEDAFELLGKRSYGGEGHNTNTILKELSVHGAFYASCIVTELYLFIKRRLLLSEMTTFLLFVVIVAAFGNEDLTVNILLFLLVFYSQRNIKYVRKA